MKWERNAKSWSKVIEPLAHGEVMKTKHCKERIKLAKTLAVSRLMETTITKGAKLALSLADVLLM